MDRASIIAEYLAPVRGGTAKPVESRVRDLWWPELLKRLDVDGVPLARVLDELDVCMSLSRDRLQQMASDYALECGFEVGTRQHVQRVSQFLKSNTGKMFERFIGYAMAEALSRVDSPYAIYGFNSRGRSLIPDIEKDAFLVEVQQGDQVFSTLIDADLIMFDPTGAHDDLFMVSVKSTLKDRFHNVPFWNLLRQVAVGSDTSLVRARHPDVLQRVKYIAMCTDLATEQPDFADDSGPRNLLQIDAALLDGAFVTGSKTNGVLGSASSGALGSDRDQPFMMLSTLLPILSQ